MKDKTQCHHRSHEGEPPLRSASSTARMFDDDHATRPMAASSADEARKEEPFDTATMSAWHDGGRTYAHLSTTRTSPMPRAGDRIAGRYLLGRTLGTGAFGRVFYAWDEGSAREVAVKVLKDTHAHALLHFKREFRALDEVRHPHLVRVHHLGRDGETWFIVMEMLHGVSLLPWMLSDDDTHVAYDQVHPPSMLFATTKMGVVEKDLRRASVKEIVALDKPMVSVERIEHYFSQLADGVHALHQMNIVHCDLKPSNIVVTPEGRVVILDFGVVRYMLHIAAHNQDEGVFAGTRHYMAPEASSAETAPTTAYDWYAVGVMLWQFLTGLFPESLDEWTASQRDALCMDAAQRFPSYAHLYRLCQALLSPLPDGRACYEDIVAACTSSPSIDTRQQAFTSRRSMTTLIGRGEEQTRLWSLWERFNQGSPQTVLIEGAPGTGKTALCEAFLQEVHRVSSSTRVLLAQCHSHESVGFRAFDEIVDGVTTLIATMPDDERDEVLPLCTPALCQLFPVLRSLDARLDEDDVHADAWVDPRFALRALLCHIAARYPVVIWLEDVEMADEDSLQWIGQIFTPALRPEAFLLITKNTREIAHDEPFDIDTLGYAIERIVLRPLVDGAAQQLVTSWLPETVRTDPLVVSRVVRMGAGRPQMLRLLCTQFDDFHDLGAHATAASLLARRVAALPHVQRDVLIMTAVSNRTVPRSAVAFATGEDMSVVDEAIEALLDATLIRYALVGHTQELDIVHEDVRQAVLDTMDDEQKQHWHAQLIKAAGACPDFAMRPLTLLSHLFLAGNYEHAQQEGHRFAQIAEKNGAYAAAAQIENRLMDMARERGVRLTTGDRMRAVELNVRAGQLVRAADLLVDLADEAHTPEEAQRLRARAEETYLLCGHLDAAREQQQKQETKRVSLGYFLPRIPRFVHIVWLKERLMRRVDARRASMLATSDAATASDGHDAPMFRMPGLDMGLVDPILGIELAMRSLHVALDSRDAVHIARALSGVSPIMGSSSARELQIALDWTRLAMTIGERADDPLTVQWARISQGNIDYQRGDYALGWEKLRQGRTWVEQNASSQSMIITYANAHLIYCAWAMGNVPALRAAYYGQLGDVRARNNKMLEAAITIGGFNTWLIDDAPEAARRCLTHLEFPDTGGPFRLLDFFKMYYSGEISLYQSKVEDIDGYIRALMRFERTLIARMVAPVRNAARFLLARMLMARAVHSDQTDARALFVQLQLIGRRLRQSSEVLGQGWGHQVIAVSHLFRGDREKARFHYQRAVDHFEARHVAIFAEPTRAAMMVNGLVDTSGDPYQRLHDMGIVSPQRYVRVCHPYV